MVKEIITHHYRIRCPFCRSQDVERVWQRKTLRRYFCRKKTCGKSFKVQVH